MRTWSNDDPKAGLMARKRAQIVAAAMQAFLEHGYAASSVNKIADTAGVSIKTLYRHFETKDELFSAVMQLACSNPSADAVSAQARPAWFAESPDVGLPRAGEEYLQHILSREQLAIYRVVTRDAHRFPELRQRYRQEVLGRQAALFADYITHWQSLKGWQVANRLTAAAVYGGILKGPFFEDAVQGGHMPTEAEISQWSRRAANAMLQLLETGVL